MAAEDISIPFPLNEMRFAFLAPWEALHFLWKNKVLFFIALASHILVFLLYLVVVSQWALPPLQEITTQHLSSLTAESFLYSLLSHLFLFSFYVLVVLLYSVLGIPFANLLLSPLFDVLATKAYEWVSDIKLPNLGFGDFVRSFWLELFKLAFIAFIFLATVFSIWLIFLAPITFLFTVWFYGWQELDRTLALTGLAWKKRLWFALRHFPACLSFGIWFYIPLVGTLLAFVMTAGAGILVARIQTASEKEEIKSIAQQKLNPNSGIVSIHDDRR